MKVFVDIDGGCSCYEVNVVGISTDPNHGGQEIEVKLSGLLSVTFDTSINAIDELITKHQNYIEASEDIVRKLDGQIRDLQVKLSYKASEDRQQAAKDELVEKLQRAVNATYNRNVALENEIKDLKAKLKDKDRGYRFAGFKDKYGQLWTPVVGRNGMFEFRGEMYSAGFLKNNAEYLAVPYHEEME